MGKPKEIGEVGDKVATAKAGCKKCHGRGYIGFDIIKGEYVGCKCLNFKDKK